MKLKILYNIAAQIAGKAVGAGGGLLVAILVARAFGVKGYGEFTAIISYITLFYMVADFGMNAVVVRESGEEEEKWFSNLLGLRIAWGLGLVFLSLAVAIFLPYNSEVNIGFSDKIKLGIVFGGGLILSQAVITSSNGVFQKKLNYGKALVCQFLGALVMVLAVWIFINLEFPLVMVVLGQVLGGGGAAVLGFFLARRYIKKLRPVLDVDLWKEILKQSLPLGLVLVFNLIYFRGDALFLAYFKGSQDVGIYGLGYKFFEVILAVPTFFMNSVYPVMVVFAKESKERLKGAVVASFIFLLVISIIFLIFIWILAPYFIKIVGEPGFEDSVGVLRILSLFLPFFFLSALFMWYLILIKKQNILAYIYFLGMSVNIVLNFIFIPKYSYWASTIITGASEGLVLLLLGFFGYKNLVKEENES